MERKRKDITGGSRERGPLALSIYKSEGTTAPHTLRYVHTVVSPVVKWTEAEATEWAASEFKKFCEADSPKGVHYTFKLAELNTSFELIEKTLARLDYLNGSPYYGHSGRPMTARDLERELSKVEERFHPKEPKPPRPSRSKRPKPAPAVPIADTLTETLLLALAAYEASYPARRARATELEPDDEVIQGSFDFGDAMH